MDFSLRNRVKINVVPYNDLHERLWNGHSELLFALLKVRAAERKQKHMRQKIIQDPKYLPALKFKTITTILNNFPGSSSEANKFTYENTSRRALDRISKNPQAFEQFLYRKELCKILELLLDDFAKNPEQIDALDAGDQVKFYQFHYNVYFADKFAKPLYERFKIYLDPIAKRIANDIDHSQLEKGQIEEITKQRQIEYDRDKTPEVRVYPLWRDDAMEDLVNKWRDKIKAESNCDSAPEDWHLGTYSDGTHIATLDMLKAFKELSEENHFEHQKIMEALQREILRESSSPGPNLITIERYRQDQFNKGWGRIANSTVDPDSRAGKLLKYIKRGDLFKFYPAFAIDSGTEPIAIIGEEADELEAEHPTIAHERVVRDHKMASSFAPNKTLGGTALWDFADYNFDYKQIFLAAFVEAINTKTMHDLGVTHSDKKPGNLIYFQRHSNQNEIQETDLELIRHGSDDIKKIFKDVFDGTPAYSSQVHEEIGEKCNDFFAHDRLALALSLATMLHLAVNAYSPDYGNIIDIEKTIEKLDRDHSSTSPELRKAIKAMILEPDKPELLDELIAILANKHGDKIKEATDKLIERQKDYIQGHLDANTRKSQP